MTVEELRTVLGWCMVINFGLMLLWLLCMKVAPDLTYRTQALMTNISREEFDRSMYNFMGYFKLGIILLNFSPYIALRILY